MEMLDKNMIEQMVRTLEKWGYALRDPWSGCGIPLKCNGPFFHEITDGLKACGEEFYPKCPRFHDIGRVCDFEPAIDASKWKEKITMEKIAQLESKVSELEVALKKRG